MQEKVVNAELVKLDADTVPLEPVAGLRDGPREDQTSNLPDSVRVTIDASNNQPEPAGETPVAPTGCGLRDRANINPPGYLCRDYVLY